MGTKCVFRIHDSSHFIEFIGLVSNLFNTAGRTRINLNFAGRNGKLKNSDKKLLDFINYMNLW